MNSSGRKTKYKPERGIALGVMAPEKIYPSEKFAGFQFALAITILLAISLVIRIKLKEKIKGD